jgi:hypothetical protein
MWKAVRTSANGNPQGFSTGESRARVEEAWLRSHALALEHRDGRGRDRGPKESTLMAGAFLKPWQC